VPRVPSEAAAHIGRLMAARRTRLTMTQDQLAAATSIDSSNIRAYESGRSMPSIQSLVRIAEALDVEPGELLSGITVDMFAARAVDGRRRANR
jgi:transcriptional regulator with XRE-family HTH domain